MSSLLVYDSIFGISYNFFVEFLGCIWFMPSFRTYILSGVFINYSKARSLFMDHSWGEFMVSSSLPGLINYSGSFYSLYQLNNIKIYLIRFVFIFFFLFIIV